MDSIVIRDVSPRDGLQDHPALIPTERKRELVNRLYQAGLRHIEVTSFVSRERVPQLADAEDLCTMLREDGLDGLICAAFIATRGGLARALTAGVDELSTTIPATDAMSNANFGRDRSAMLDEVLAILGDAPATTSVTIAVAFACPFEGPVPLERVLALTDTLASGGYRTILLGDTIGVANPRLVEKLFGEISMRYPELTLGAHFHDARGSGIANVVTAVDAGASIVDSALGGIGGCPFAPGAAGNVATEDVAWVLSQIGYNIGLDPHAVADAARWLPDGLAVEVSGRTSQSRTFDWEIA